MDNTQLFRNPLFLHPSDGPGSLSIKEKLIGAQNYRSWRRSIEIALSTKRKFGFVTGTITRSAVDVNEAEQWDTCNNMVISWIESSVSDSIVKSIMFVGTASEIWKQLEKRFVLSNGSRKYKLYKEMYASEQLGSTFLNGLDEHFSALRSQLLLMSPLPSVEMACSMLQQEESQREIFGGASDKFGGTSDKLSDKCATCGNKGHSPDKCWERIGYPPWHYKSRFNGKQSSNNKVKPAGIFNATKKTAANVQGSSVVFTSEQFEQLLKCLPQLSQSGTQADDFSDEIDHHFAGITTKTSLCGNQCTQWILDTGATDHMTPVTNKLKDLKILMFKTQIRLPNGNTSVISHIG
ncbi:uncharacterized protein [Rutidosis leptorrhynchoides]|uniref:uncharacterized protein n=1 Tax=Rutidosis leptorrhynchoides TaxID=125765 RepID=UPI003A9A2123